MKKILLLIAVCLGPCLYAQNTANLCENAYSLCGALGEPFLNTVNSAPAAPPDTPTFDCLVYTPNPAWFYMPVSQTGALTILMEQNKSINFDGTPLDVDFICWGPFESSDACGAELLNSTTEVGCSFSASAFESFTIPNATAGQYYKILVTNFSNLAGFIRISTIGSEGALDCSGINLNAFLDANANGTQEPEEQGFPLGTFQYEANNSGDVHTITTFNGNYTIYDESLNNSYDFQFDIAPQYAAYYSIATPSYTNVPVTAGNAVVTYNFPVVITQPYQDLGIYTIANGAPVSGFSTGYKIVYGNLGNVAVPTGTVNFTTDAAISITSASDAAAVITGNSLALNFSNLLPFEIRTFTIMVDVPAIPAVSLDQVITSTATITPVTADVSPNNNTSISTQFIIGSYDPNDKMEAHGRQVVITDFDTNDYLYYTIRFQNTGTANALNVRVEDLLDSQLDPNSVEMLHSSHDFTLDREGSHLTWKFNHINLPSQQDNEAASHGYVYFRVKPVAGFAVGDIIPNSADIYFDFNPAIVTNTFSTEFVAALATPQVATQAFMLYPNPAKNTVNITAGNTADVIASVKIYDLTGKIIYIQDNTAPGKVVINSSAFASGTYFVEILSNSNTKTIKKLLIQ